MKILFAATNHFHSPFQVGSHHLAREFAKAGWQVAFVSSAISPLHLLHFGDPQVRARWRCFRAGGLIDADTGIWSYVPGGLLTPHSAPLLRSEFIARHWWRGTLPNVVRKIRAAGYGDVDILYCDNAYQRFWLDAIKCRRSLLRIADRNTGFRGWTPAAARLEKELAAEVDLVAFSAKNLASYVASLGPKDGIYLPNGVRVDHFMHGPKDLPTRYQSMPRPIAVYVGAMDAWFDFALVNEAAERLPQVSFVLLGPAETARQRLTPRANLHLLGSVPYAALPAYLHNADVGLIPFDVKNHGELVNSINPLKMYEYMACGLPVVAVEWEELRSLGSPARLCRSADEFIQAIAESVSMHYDRSRSIRFAQDHDWGVALRMLLERLR
jgi:glycosyltransferase involved in cell wall biosynthesis